MKEEWLKDIHNQMIDYEMEEPQDLWESIQAKRSEGNKRKHRKKIIFLWTKRVTLAAAVAVLIFVANYHFDREDDIPAVSIVDSTSLKNNGIRNSLPPSSLTDEKEEATIIGNKVNSVNQEKTIVKKETIPHTQTEIAEKTLQANEIAMQEGSEEKLRSITEEKQPQEQIQEIVSEELAFEDLAQIAPRKGFFKRVSFGMFTAGGTSSTFSSKSVDRSFVASIEMDESTWRDSSLLGTLVFNQGKELQTEVKHRLPIRVGVLFTYNINNYIGIESGVTYTNLTSDMREGSENHYFTSEQKLHYVGVPINLKYRIFAQKAFQLYASSGFLVEKSVSGELIKSYFLDNQFTQTERESLKINSLQWSVNVATGVQYNFSSLIGVYAEPGISYYFDNNSPVETIYKDKPLNFNLNVGVRFTFGK